MRILFAEDEATLREFVARGLVEVVYAVDAVADGEAAWVAAAAVPYAIAILVAGATAVQAGCRGVLETIRRRLLQNDGQGNRRSLPSRRRTG